jgi:hypothetical protein
MDWRWRASLHSNIGKQWKENNLNLRSSTISEKIIIKVANVTCTRVYALLQQ